MASFAILLPFFNWEIAFRESYQAIKCLASNEPQKLEP